MIRRGALLRYFTRRGRLPAEAAPVPVQPPASYQGYIEQLGPHHVEGWVHNLAGMAERTDLIVRRGDTGELIAQGRADHFRYGLSDMGIGDGGHGFHIRFPTVLSQEAVSQLEVVPVPGGVPLPSSPRCSSAYEPMILVSMDIVNNCNLRCPFCLYDYADIRETHVMEEATLDAALRFLPYVTDGNFWFSCLHEPTLHPRMMDFIDKVPREWRKKVFFTTNLAKRMPDSYFAWLVDAGLHHVNISIESLDPAIYERMRKGARFRIFQENWDKLVAAIAVHPEPTPIRYIAMVYRSNYRELPALVRYLLEERHGALVELRYTFDVPHLPKDFRDAEFLEPEGWLWLRDQLAGYRSDQVSLVLPPEVRPETPRLDIDLAERFAPKPQSGARHFLPGRYQARLSWDGTFQVSPFWAHPFEEGPKQRPITTLPVTDIADPVRFLAELPE